MDLGELIAWLEKQPADAKVMDGFGSPHSDRGSYEDLAFRPVGRTTIGEMLAHARSAMGKTFTGYKGGDYVMNEYTTVKIGNWGSCGEEITQYSLKYWDITAHM